MSKHFLILNLIFACFITNTFAGDNSIINFSVTERDYAYEDVIKTTLVIEEDNKDPKELQASINKKMTEALATAKQFSQIEASTDSYYVYQNTPVTTNKNPNSSDTTWHGNQQLLLKTTSTSSADLLNLANKLQSQGMLMRDLTFALSSEASEKIKDELLGKAMKKLQDKANLFAKLLNKKNAKIIELNVDNPQPMIMYKAAMSRMMNSDGTNDAPPPVAEPTKVEVNLNVNAKISVE